MTSASVMLVRPPYDMSHGAAAAERPARGEACLGTDGGAFSLPTTAVGLECRGWSPVFWLLYESGDASTLAVRSRWSGAGQVTVAAAQVNMAATQVTVASFSTTGCELSSVPDGCDVGVPGTWCASYCSLAWPRSCARFRRRGHGVGVESLLDHDAHQLGDAGDAGDAGAAGATVSMCPLYPDYTRSNPGLPAGTCSRRCGGRIATEESAR